MLEDICKSKNRINTIIRSVERGICSVSDVRTVVEILSLKCQLGASVLLRSSFSHARDFGWFSVMFTPTLLTGASLNIVPRDWNILLLTSSSSQSSYCRSQVIPVHAFFNLISQPCWKCLTVCLDSRLAVVCDLLVFTYTASAAFHGPTPGEHRMIAYISSSFVILGW